MHGQKSDMLPAGSTVHSVPRTPKDAWPSESSSPTYWSAGNAPDADALRFAVCDSNLDLAAAERTAAMSCLPQPSDGDTKSNMFRRKRGPALSSKDI